MKDQLGLVFELNQKDRQVDECRERLEGIRVRREEMEAEIQGKRTSFEGKSAQVLELEKDKRGKEAEVEFSESRLKEFHGKISQIKTNKEYQAALKEIAESKKGNKIMEDQILEIMTKVDGLKKETQALEESLQGLVASFEKETSELSAEEERCQGLIQEVEQDRKRLLSLLEGKVLDQYQRIKKIRKDAVTFVDGGACQGCHMHIPPQLYIEIQKSKTLHSCPSCHRILYLREWEKESMQ